MFPGAGTTECLCRRRAPQTRSFARAVPAHLRVVIGSRGLRSGCTSVSLRCSCGAGNIFCAIFILNMILHRDRLGTNVGKTQEEMRFSQGASAAQAWCENSLLLKFAVLEKWIISQDRLGTDIRITQKHVRRFRRRSAGLFDALAQSDRVRSGCQRGIAGLCWECAGRTRQPQGCSRCDNTAQHF
jgi:hypothetical protein